MTEIKVSTGTVSSSETQGILSVSVRVLARLNFLWLIKNEVSVFFFSSFYLDIIGIKHYISFRCGK